MKYLQIVENSGFNGQFTSSVAELFAARAANLSWRLTSEILKLEWIVLFIDMNLVKIVVYNFVFSRYVI